MHFNRYTRPSLAFVLLLASPVALAQADGNPGYDRPGLGFTPSVLDTGDIMLEQGLPDLSHDDGLSNLDADTLLRVGIGHALELQAGTGWSWLDGHGQHADGRADTSLAVKWAPAARGRFSWGLLGSVELTDGARAFRTPDRQYLLGASFNWDHDAGRSSGLYAELGGGNASHQLLAINEGWQWGASVAVYAELGLQHAHDEGSGSIAGAGLVWNMSPRVQWDISARHRLGGHVDQWQGGMGLAVYFGG